MDRGCGQGATRAGSIARNATHRPSALDPNAQCCVHINGDYSVSRIGAPAGRHAAHCSPLVRRAHRWPRRRRRRSACPSCCGRSSGRGSRRRWRRRRPSFLSVPIPRRSSSCSSGAEWRDVAGDVVRLVVHDDARTRKVIFGLAAVSRRASPTPPRARPSSPTESPRRSSRSPTRSASRRACRRERSSSCTPSIRWSMRRPLPAPARVPRRERRRAPALERPAAGYRGRLRRGRRATGSRRRPRLGVARRSGAGRREPLLASGACAFASDAASDGGVLERRLRRGLRAGQCQDRERGGISDRARVGRTLSPTSHADD